MTELKFKFVTMMNHFYLQSALTLAEGAFILRKAKPDGTDHHPQVVGAILCSSAFLEVIINDFFEEARTANRRSHFRDGLRDVWDDGFDRQPILSRFQIALALGKLPRFVPGTEPYQSVKALLNLRNSLSHPKVVFGIHGEDGLRKILLGKYKFTVVDKHHSFFPDACLSPECATWAARTVAVFADDFYSRVPKSMKKYSMNLSTYIKRSKVIDLG